MQKRYAFFQFDGKQIESSDEPLESGGFKGFATKPVVDRVGDVVNPMGVLNLDEYRNNPVVLFNHNVNMPVARAINIDARADGLWNEGRFGRKPEAQAVRMDVEDGIINAQSIGFQPVKTRPINGEADARALLQQHGMDFDTLSEKAQSAIVTDGEYIETWNLYEISLVSVPANPAAVIQFAKSLSSATLTKEMDGGDSVAPPDFAPALNELLRQLNYEGKPTTPFAELPIAQEGVRWNPRGTRDSVLINAILGGDPDAPNWQRFKDAHFWFDNADTNLPDTQAAYKLKFARMFTANDPENVNPDTGQLTAIWPQVASRMAILMGAREGVNMPDEQRRSVYNHMVRYYRMWDKEPPEFKGDIVAVKFDNVVFKSGELQILDEALQETDHEVDAVPAVKVGRVISAQTRTKILSAIEIMGEARRAMQAAERGLKDLLSLSESPAKAAGATDSEDDTSRDSDLWLALASKAQALTEEVNK